MSPENDQKQPAASEANCSQPNGSAPFCACVFWCRTDGKPTNHHPNCPHYNDSLIPVWRFTSSDGSSYVTDREPGNFDLIEASESEVSVSREEMHREIYDNLKEFDGF